MLMGLLAGCFPRNRPWKALPTTLYIAVGVEKAPDKATERQQLKALRNQLLVLQNSFRDVQPGVLLELIALENKRFLDEVRRRTRSGLGPDLMLVDSNTAEELHQRKLSTLIPFPNPKSHLLEPEVVPYVQLSNDRWFAMPVSLQPQMACFDRRRMSSAPQTMKALLEASSNGKNLGLGLKLSSLMWTTGSLGALQAISQVRQGNPVSSEQISSIQQWLSWLRSAEFQRRLSLVSSQAELVKGLRSGRFDWISCYGRDANLLRLELGTNLGLAPLPSGPGGAASPISTLRVWAYGRNSSHRQRRVAEALVNFTLSSPAQRGFTIQTQGGLPVSTEATLPVASSSNLAALITAQQQARQAHELTESLIGLHTEKATLNRTLTRFRYGGLDSAEAASSLIETLRPRPSAP